MMINYDILNQSIQFYSKFGYQRIESPWLVSEAIDNITKPENKRHFQLKHNDKCLVASGEQSFLYLFLKGYLPKGKYQTITPCFRDDKVDNLHLNHFMKNELINTLEVSTQSLNSIIDNAFNFFAKVIEANGLSTETLYQMEPNYDDGSIDIKYAGYELGSYGVRSCHSLDWVYGTGVAEPRLSNILEIIKKKNGISQRNYN